MSKEITRGAKVPVRCSVSPGAFLNEYLITIDTTEGHISGFIDAQEVIKDGTGRTHVYGFVHEIEDDRIVISLPGSFFTTTGIAHFSRKMLDNVL